MAYSLSTSSSALIDMLVLLMEQVYRPSSSWETLVIWRLPLVSRLTLGSARRDAPLSTSLDRKYTEVDRDDYTENTAREDGKTKSQNCDAR